MWLILRGCDYFTPTPMPMPQPCPHPHHAHTHIPTPTHPPTHWDTLTHPHPCPCHNHAHTHTTATPTYPHPHPCPRHNHAHTHTTPRPTYPHKYTHTQPPSHTNPSRAKFDWKLLFVDYFVYNIKTFFTHKGSGGAPWHILTAVRLEAVKIWQGMDGHLFVCMSYVFVRFL